MDEIDVGTEFICTKSVSDHMGNFLLPGSRVLLTMKYNPCLGNWVQVGLSDVYLGTEYGYYLDLPESDLRDHFTFAPVKESK